MAHWGAAITYYSSLLESQNEHKFLLMGQVKIVESRKLNKSYIPAILFWAENLILQANDSVFRQHPIVFTFSFTN